MRLHAPRRPPVGNAVQSAAVHPQQTQDAVKSLSLAGRARLRESRTDEFRVVGHRSAGLAVANDSLSSNHAAERWLAEVSGSAAASKVTVCAMAPCCVLMNS